MNARELRRARLEAAYEEAANDPVFMAEMQATTEAFEVIAADGLCGPREDGCSPRDRSSMLEHIGIEFDPEE
jgi:hypothetical protein